MDPQFEQFASRLTKDISVKVDEAVSNAEDRIDLRFSTRLEEAKNELKHQAQLNQEELRERITMAADGFAGTLESIKRQLDELNSKVDTKFTDHDSVLASHHQRITALERLSST